ncbi:MAG: hypothetical protein AB7F94_14360 [Nitrospira sp.]
MEPARKLDYPQDWNKPSSGAPKPSKPDHVLDKHKQEDHEQEIQPWDIKLGKMIFYLTIAMGIWFFYWLNGIQCPC